MSKCKGTKVTAKEVEKMVILYDALESYKAVGAKMHRNPDTVSRHVQAYKLAAELDAIRKVRDGII